MTGDMARCHNCKRTFGADLLYEAMCPFCWLETAHKALQVFGKRRKVGPVLRRFDAVRAYYSKAVR